MKHRCQCCLCKSPPTAKKWRGQLRQCLMMQKRTRRKSTAMAKHQNLSLLAVGTK